MKAYFYLPVVILLTAAVSGCNPYNNEGEGAATGGALGALAGGIIGHQSHDTGAGMIIGGALGAVTGAAVGSTVQKPDYEAPAPTVVGAPAPSVPSTVYSGDTVTVNVPNNSGGYTSVLLKRSGNGYVGPQGEYYDQIPSTEQLQAMYGR
jgi:hypothetical protein